MSEYNETNYETNVQSDDACRRTPLATLEARGPSVKVVTSSWVTEYAAGKLDGGAIVDPHKACILDDAILERCLALDDRVLCRSEEDGAVLQSQNGSVGLPGAYGTRLTVVVALGVVVEHAILKRKATGTKEEETEVVARKVAVLNEQIDLAVWSLFAVDGTIVANKLALVH